MISLNPQQQTYQQQLFDASEVGDERTVRNLVAKGADPDLLSIHGETSVHIASSYGNEAVVRVLAELRADLNKPDTRGQTSVYIAASHNQLSLVRVLIELGADPNIPVEDSGGSITPLKVALILEHVSIVRELIGMVINFRTTLPILVECAQEFISIHKQIFNEKTLTQFHAEAKLRIENKLPSDPFNPELEKVRPLVRLASLSFMKGVIGETAIDTWQKQKKENIPVILLNKLREFQKSGGGFFFLQAQTIERKELQTKNEDNIHQEIRFSR